MAASSMPRSRACAARGRSYRSREAAGKLRRGFRDCATGQRLDRAGGIDRIARLLVMGERFERRGVVLAHRLHRLVAVREVLGLGDLAVDAENTPRRLRRADMLEQ